MIFTGLSPNLQSDDLWLSIRLLFQPWRWQRGSAEQQLKQQLEQLFGTQHIWPVNSGRTALLVILKSLHLQSTDEVLMQAFTCNAVSNPIRWAGAKPIYVDVDPQTLCMAMSDLQKKITPQSKVLIIQHTFGTPANLAGLLSVARQHNLFVIEDCAHALGASYQGTLLGTYGDAAIFSFGRDKVISSVYGGALLVKRPGFVMPALPYPSMFWIKQQLLHPLITTVAKHIRLVLPVAQKLKLISLAVSAKERAGQQPTYFPARLPNALAALASHQLSKLEQYNQHRRVIAKLYSECLEDDCHPASIYLRYCIFVRGRQALLHAAKRRGVILGDWYDVAVVPSSLDYPAGSCPAAEHLAKHVVNLPTHIAITPAIAQQICDVIKPYYESD